MKYNEVRTIHLTLPQAADLISKELGRICGRPAPCYIKVEEVDFWSVCFLGWRMPLSEVMYVMEQVHMDANDFHDSLPEDNSKDVGSLGPFVSASLLSGSLDLIWEKEISTEDGIWLIDVRKAEEKKVKSFIYNDINVNVDELMGRDEVMEYLEKNGGTYEALSDILNANAEKYGNELCWHYPITDDLHTGTYILLVKEGALALPYTLVNEEGFEGFCLEDVSLFAVESLDIFLEDWRRYTDDIFGALYAFRCLHVQMECEK